MLKTLCILILLAVSVCPEQQFLPTAGLDMTKVAVDPVTGQPLVFLRLTGSVGKPIVISGRACDPDLGDPNAVPQTLRMWREPSMVDVPLDPNGVYSVEVIYSTPGLKYETFGVTDGVGDANSVRMGTVVIDVRKANRPPVLCGGLP